MIYFLLYRAESKQREPLDESCLCGETEASVNTRYPLTTPSGFITVRGNGKEKAGPMKL
jgi:hypothetical protein